MTYEIADVILPGNDKAFEVGSRAEVGALADLDPVHLALIDKPVTACLATTKASGKTQLTPVWLNHDGTYLQLNSVRGRVKDRNLRARPDLTLLLINPENPYHWISIDGTVTEIIDEDDPQRGKQATDNIDDLAESYLGVRPYPLRDPNGEIRVLYKVTPTRIMTFGPVEG